jgi:hypothetical protein
MAFFDTIAQLYNAARGVIPFGKDTATGLPVPLEMSATGRLLVDADIAAGGALATEATLANIETEATTANGHLVSIDAELVDVNSTLVFVDESISISGGLSTGAFTTIRNFSSTAADSEPPADVSYVAIPQHGAVEFALLPMTFGGTVAPTQMRIRYWGRTSVAPATNIKLHEEILDCSQLALTAATNAILARRFNAMVDHVYATITFLDGTSPTVATGSIIARAIALQARDDTTFKRDPTTGNPIAQGPEYDGLTNTAKTTQMNLLVPAQTEVGVISETSRASGSTYYWPSDAGIDVGDHDTITFQYSITGATTSATSTTWQGTVDGTTWFDCTLGCVDVTTGATLSGAITTTAGGSSSKCIVVKDCNWAAKIRQAVAVTTANTGAVSCSIRRSTKGKA